MAEVLSPRPDHQTASSSFFSTSRDTPDSVVADYYTGHASSMLNVSAAAAHSQGNSSLRSHASSTSLSSRTSTSDLSNLAALSTPPSSVSSSLEDKYRQFDDEDDYPQYGSYDALDDEPEEGDTTDDTTLSELSIPTPVVSDDTAVQQQPSRHVDYLSHNWKEEDVWSSWRHIVSQRKVYGQQSRLENAAWRTWVKNKYQLRTVSPETLNWLKESDVTWLYGPLKPAQTHPVTQDDSETGSRISKSNSFILNKKPILKKRSMSEVMLQRSISTSSLVQQAAASIQAQGKRGRRGDPAGSDFITSALVSEPPSREGGGSVVSTSSSGTQTPNECREKKHIRFHDTVEQCIAVVPKPDEDDEEELEFEERPGSSLSSNSSDEGLVMMRKPRRPSLYARVSSSRGSRSNSHQGRKTIETLPSTTLKYRTDSPEVSEEQQQAAMARSWGGRPRLSPSASQETLRPSRPSKNFLLGEEEEEDDDDSSNWSFGSSNPRSSLGSSASSETLRRSALPHSRSSIEAHRGEHDNEASTSRTLPALESEPGAYGIQGLRRTESGMFMPEDDEDDIIASGLFGKISETVNTARDIAHVIWNVGWRK